jgi:hypothetical protein
VDDNDLPITMNNFTGTATIFDFTEGTAIGYNAYGFKRSGGTGTPGVLNLNGTEYDKCPAYLLGTFMIDGTSFGVQQHRVTASPGKLTLVPCDQDLRQDRLPIYTKANFTVWDEDEVGFTGAYMCFKCWIDTTLTDPPAATRGARTLQGFRNFTEVVVGGVYATVKITPVSGDPAVCNFPAKSPARPFLGLLFGSAYLNGKYASYGSLLQSPSTGWVGDAPTIKYDAAGGGGGTPERNER